MVAFLLLTSVFSTGNCTNLQLNMYSGYDCVTYDHTSPITHYKDCAQSDDPDSAFASVVGYCSVGGLLVKMDSTLITAYQGNYGCNYQPVGFQALATDLCLNIFGNNTFLVESDYVTCSAATSKLILLCCALYLVV